jgi:hypothetical protein
MNYLTCHIFTVFASYFDFAAFSSLAIPCADRRKTLETAAERSSFCMAQGDIIQDPQSTIRNPNQRRLGFT